LDLLPLSPSMVAELLYVGGAHIGDAFGQVWWVLPLQLLVPKRVFRFPAAFVWQRPVILFLQEFFDGSSATSRVILVRFVFLLRDGFGLEFSDPFLGSSSCADGGRHGGNKWHISVWLMADFRLCIHSTTLSCYSWPFQNLRMLPLFRDQLHITSCCDSNCQG
jgi:hypothetical protein